MNALIDFIKDLLTMKTVWVHKGGGHWVVRRRMHPVMRLLVWGGALATAVSLGMDYMRNDGGTPVIAPVADLTTASRDVAELPPASSQDVPDTPLAVLPEGVSDAPTPQPDADREPETDVQQEPVNPTKAAAPASRPSTRGGARGRREAVSPGKPQSPGDYRIEIVKGQYKLSLYKGSELVKTYDIAVGRNPGNKRYAGDNRTPEGDFRVRSIENASRWTHDFRDGKGEIAGAYGPWFIRLDAGGWRGIGIHGTHDPDSLGTMASEGCIRMDNEDIQELKQYAYRNMKVVIRE